MTFPHLRPLRQLLHTPFAVFLLALTIGASARAQNWEQVKDFKGGIILCMLQHPDGRLLVGTLGSGIWFSSDEGKRWTPRNTGLTARDIHDILVASDGSLFVATSDTVFKSTNGGDSWFHASKGLNQAGVNCLQQSGNGVIIAGTEGRGMFVTTDLGATWSKQNNAMASLRITRMLNAGGNRIYAATVNSGVFVTVDNGNSWRNLSDSLKGRALTALASRGGNELYVGSTGGGVQRSLDTGRSWTSVNTGFTCPDIRAIAVAPGGTLYAGTTDVCTGAGGVFRSSNDGASWQFASQGVFNRNVQALFALRDDAVFCGSQGDGIYLSTDGGTVWNASNEGFHAVTVQSMAASSTGAVFAATLGAGVYRSLDGGATWTRANNGVKNLNVTSVAVSPAGTVFVAADDLGQFRGGVLRSTDNGDSWQSVNFGLPNGNRINCLAAGPDGAVYHGTPNNWMFRSTDNGEFWVPAKDGVPSRIVPALVCDEFGRVYAGTYGNSGVLLSTNAGATWTQQSNGMAADYNIASVFPLTERMLFAGSSSGLVYRSTDQGGIWTTVKTFTGIRAKAFSTTPAGALLLGYDGLGVFLSDNYGVTWKDVNTGLSDLHVIALAMAKDGSLLAGTYGAGVFRSSGTNEARPPASAVSMQLSAFPDPFREATQIEWTLPQASRITLRLFDALGREVATLFSRDAEAGRQSFVFDARSLSPALRAGVYHLSLTSRSGVVTRMVRYLP